MCKGILFGVQRRFWRFNASTAEAFLLKLAVTDATLAKENQAN